MPLRLRPPAAFFALSVALLCLGTLAGSIWMLASPASYVALADLFAWRMSWPSIVQIRLEDTTTRLHLRGDALVRSGDILIFGDSHLHGLPASALPRATNYAIGGETAARLAQRMPRYGSVQRAGLVIVLTGRNDLAMRTPPALIAQFHDQILKAIPGTTPLMLLPIPPASESAEQRERLAETNRLLAALCHARPRCQFLTLNLADADGNLSAAYDAGDGIHLNTAGYQLLQATIDKALSPTRPSPQ